MGRVRYLENKPTEEIKLIEGSRTDYISNTGNVYKRYDNGRWIKKNQTYTHGYLYCGITYEKENKTKNINKRVHRLVAKAFIPNPEDKPIVMHLNNKKDDNRVENLKWGTVSENTKQAFDDGLARNDIGIEDNQSYPVAFYKNDGTLISVYGSISSAGRLIEGSSKSSISKVIDKTTKGRKGYYFKTITKEEYFSYPESIKELKYEIPYIKKNRIKFKAIYKDKNIYISDNQKQFAKEHNLNQAIISLVLRTDRIFYNEDWDFYKIAN